VDTVGGLASLFPHVVSAVVPQTELGFKKVYKLFEASSLAL
jgi:hypothetical protein